MEKVETYKCQYCNKDFKREKTLAVHMCEQKRRHLAFKDKDVQYGFATYNKFYQYTQNKAKTKTPTEFAKSPYYTAFVRFGKYIIDTQCIGADRFIQWVIKSGIKLDNWAKDSTYTKYLEERIKIESINDALIRAIEYSEVWATDRDMEAKDILRYGSASRLCYAIAAGHISPWILYTSQSGQDFLGRLASEQTKLIYDIIEPEKWHDIMIKRAEDVEVAKAVLGELGW